ncbi:hypothetical protein HanPI659440_Chr16g0654331 [Helianthus annuus]|nr:hypothetical protein HanPI659440_Chr16g0654331 [Helianthus annuus]
MSNMYTQLIGRPAPIPYSVKFGETLRRFITCETYLRCQVYHPSMETDWDLQAVPITSRSPLTNMFPSFSTTMNLDPNRKIPWCPKCSSEYEHELAKLKELEKSRDEVNNSLPQWLQNAKLKDQSQDQEPVLKQKIQELQKKWRDECFRIHSNYNQSSRLDRVAPMVVPFTGAYKPNMLLGQSQPGQHLEVFRKLCSPHNRHGQSHRKAPLEPIWLSDQKNLQKGPFGLRTFWVASLQNRRRVNSSI